MVKVNYPKPSVEYSKCSVRDIRMGVTGSRTDARLRWWEDQLECCCMGPSEKC